MPNDQTINENWRGSESIFNIQGKVKNLDKTLVLRLCQTTLYRSVRQKVTTYTDSTFTSPSSL